MYWYRITNRAAWRNLTEARADFPSTDAVQPFTVFNIGGNRFRLIAVVKYQWQIVYIRQILTHREYDRGNWKSS